MRPENCSADGKWQDFSGTLLPCVTDAQRAQPLTYGRMCQLNLTVFVRVRVHIWNCVCVLSFSFVFAWTAHICLSVSFWARGPHSSQSGFLICPVFPSTYARGFARGLLSCVSHVVDYRDVRVVRGRGYRQGASRFSAEGVGTRMKLKRGAEVHRLGRQPGSKTTKISLELKYRKIRRSENAWTPGRCSQNGESGWAWARIRATVSSIRLAPGTLKIKRAYFQRVRVKNVSFYKTCGQSSLKTPAKSRVKNMSFFGECAKKAKEKCLGVRTDFAFRVDSLPKHVFLIFKGYFFFLFFKTTYF
jgi:hypothetical protein